MGSSGGSWDDYSDGQVTKVDPDIGIENPKSLWERILEAKKIAEEKVRGLVGDTPVDLAKGFANDLSGAISGQAKAIGNVTGLRTPDTDWENKNPLQKFSEVAGIAPAMRGVQSGVNRGELALASVGARHLPDSVVKGTVEGMLGTPLTRELFPGLKTETSPDLPTIKTPDQIKQENGVSDIQAKGTSEFLGEASKKAEDRGKIIANSIIEPSDNTGKAGRFANAATGFVANVVTDPTMPFIAAPGKAGAVLSGLMGTQVTGDTFQQAEDFVHKPTAEGAANLLGNSIFAGLLLHHGISSIEGVQAHPEIVKSITEGLASAKEKISQPITDIQKGMEVKAARDYDVTHPVRPPEQIPAVEMNAGIDPTKIGKDFSFGKDQVKAPGEISETPVTNPEVPEPVEHKVYESKPSALPEDALPSERLKELVDESGNHLLADHNPDYIPPAIEGFGPGKEVMPLEQTISGLQQIEKSNANPLDYKAKVSPEDAAILAQTKHNVSNTGETSVTNDALKHDRPNPIIRAFPTSDGGAKLMFVDKDGQVHGYAEVTKRADGTFGVGDSQIVKPKGVERNNARDALLQARTIFNVKDRLSDFRSFESAKSAERNLRVNKDEKSVLRDRIKNNPEVFDNLGLNHQQVEHGLADLFGHLDPDEIGGSSKEAFVIRKALRSGKLDIAEQSPILGSVEEANGSRITSENRPVESRPSESVDSGASSELRSIEPELSGGNSPESGLGRSGVDVSKIPDQLKGIIRDTPNNADLALMLEEDHTPEFDTEINQIRDALRNEEASRIKPEASSLGTSRKFTVRNPKTGEDITITPPEPKVREEISPEVVKSLETSPEVPKVLDPKELETRTDIPTEYDPRQEARLREQAAEKELRDQLRVEKQFAKTNEPRIERVKANELGPLKEDLTVVNPNELGPIPEKPEVVSEKELGNLPIDEKKAAIDLKQQMKDYRVSERLRVADQKRLQAEAKLANSRIAFEEKTPLESDTFTQGWRKLTPLGKVKEASNIVRALITTWDVPTLRQGRIIAANDPKIAFKSTVEAVRNAFGADDYAAMNEKMRLDPTFRAFFEKGREYAPDLAGIVGRREEAFPSPLAEKIPIYGKGVVAPSDRAYTGTMNLMRLEQWKKDVGKLQRKGLTLEKDPEVFQDLARVNNLLTFRGDTKGEIGKAIAGSEILGASIFSPRNKLSQYQILKKMFVNDYSSKGGLSSPKVQFRKRVAQSWAVNGIIYGSLVKAGIATMETDPESSDFMKFKIGEARINPWMGTNQILRAAYLVANGKTKSIVTGKRSDITPGDVLMREVRKSLAPGPGIVTDVASGTSISGEHVWDKNDAVQDKIFKSALYGFEHGTVPMNAWDFLNAYNQSGLAAAFGALAVGELGENINVYDTRPSSSGGKDRRRSRTRR